jgi:polysaccharide export outer membrane protein
VWVVAVVVLMLGGCTPKENFTLLKTDHLASNRKPTYHTLFEYYILPGDRVKVVLYKTPEERELLDTYPSLSTGVNSSGILVGPHGHVVLPLIGSVKISGLTQSAAAEKIARRYRKRFPKASVYLEVTNKRAYILGEVRRPGVLKMDRDHISLLEAIAMAGDLTDNAVRTAILVITHTRSGKMVMRAIDLTRFENLASMNMTIVPGDIIYVQPDKWRKTKARLNDILPMLSGIGAFISPVKEAHTLVQ